MKKFFTYQVFLVIIVSIIGSIAFGSLVKYFVEGGKNYRFLKTPVMFFSSIPVNIKKMIENNSIFLDKQKPINRHEDKKRLENFLDNKRNILLVLSRYDADISRSVVEIIDMYNFEIIHSYSHDINEMHKKVQNLEKFPRINIDHSSSRFRYFHPLIFSDGSLIAKSHESVMFKIDFCSNLIWVNDNQKFHHSSNIDHDGNILVGGIFDPPSKYIKKYQINDIKDDAITKINTDGKILYRKSVLEILIENKILPENFALTTKLLNLDEKDPLHLNDIEPVLSDTLYWKKGDMFLSLRELAAIVHYRPSSNKIINYITGPFSEQHDVDIISDKEISIFNNNNFGVDRHTSEVIVYNFENQKFKKLFNDQLKKENFKTETGGLSHILKDGGLFVDETNWGRFILFNNIGEKKIEFVNKSKKGDINMIYWSRLIEDESFIEEYKSLVKNKKCTN